MGNKMVDIEIKIKPAAKYVGVMIVSKISFGREDSTHCRQRSRLPRQARG